MVLIMHEVFVYSIEMVPFALKLLVVPPIHRHTKLAGGRAACVLNIRYITVGINFS